MGPSIIQRNDIDPQHAEVKDAVIKTGNSNEENVPNLGGILFRMLQESEERSKTTSVYFVPMPISLQLCYLLADSHHRPMNWRCRFCNSRPGLMPNHPGAEPRLDKQYQGPRQDQLVILQWNSDGILREVTALKMVHDMQQVDITWIQETKLLPKDNTPGIPQYRAVCCETQFKGRQGVEASSSMYAQHWHSLLSDQLLERPMCWRN